MSSENDGTPPPLEDAESTSSAQSPSHVESMPPPTEDSVDPVFEPQNATSGDNPEAPLENSEGRVGTQERIVNKLIKTIGRLRTENALLEMKISDSDRQNKLLQLQIDIMIKKMELLEGFMEQVRRMESDGYDENSGLCRKCKQRIEKLEQLDAKSDDECDEDDKRSDSMQENDDHGVQNPLMIDLVLGDVFRYLSINSLLKCRQINHLWNEEATFILKQRQLLTINQHNIEKLSELMDLATTSFSNSFLFRRIKFDIGFLVKTYREILDNFFIRYGPEIQDFSLHCEQENSAILYTEEVRNVFLPHLTNVKSLEMSVPTKITERQTFYDEFRPKMFLFVHLTTLKLRHMDMTLDIGGYNVPVVKEILKMTPNLTSLRVETHTREVVTRILQGMNDKDCRNVTNQLQELYLDAYITEEHLSILLPLDFKLTSLQLSYFTVEVSSALLEAFLTKQRTTLKTFIVGDYQKRTTVNSPPLIIKLPVMRELTHFKFVDPMFPNHRQIMFNPLNYSEQLPALKELSFEHETGKPAGPHYFHDMFICSPSACMTLTTLRVSHGLGDVQLVVSAAKMFPNLWKLEIANSPDPVIQALWRELTGLKILHLTLNPTNLNIDSLLTGIPDQVCRRIQERNLFAQVDIMSALDIIRTESSICNLTELSTLRIDGFTSTLLTAVTGYLALCHMKNLSNIAIKSDVITLSRECQRVLSERLHLVTLDFF